MKINFHKKIQRKVGQMCHQSCSLAWGLQVLTSQPSETHGNAYIATGKLVLNKDSVLYKGMLGDRTFTCKSSFFPHQEV